MNAPYLYKNYRDFIEAKLASEEFGRGSRTTLSEFLGVQKSFVSLVLSGKFDFTPEHVFRIAKFLRLDSEDRECLLLMIHRDRTGSDELRAYYSSEIKKIKDEREMLRSQINADSSLSEAQYSLYTGAWYHIAVHMCIRNPEMREIGRISKYLKITPEEVSHSLKLLERIGFAEQIKGVWHSRVVRYNANKESPGLRSLHSNCRHLATHSLDSPDVKDLHYSLVVSIDKKAVEQLRQKILELVKNFEPIIQKAEDEEVVAFTLDLFKLGRLD